jgi:hypothetical protein
MVQAQEMNSSNIHQSFFTIWGILSIFAFGDYKFNPNYLKNGGMILKLIQIPLVGPAFLTITYRMYLIVSHLRMLVITGGPWSKVNLNAGADLVVLTSFQHMRLWWNKNDILFDEQRLLIRWI